MKRILMTLMTFIIVFVIVFLNSPLIGVSHAALSGQEPTQQELLKMKEVTKKVFNKTIDFKPRDIVTVLQYLETAYKDGFKDVDPEIAKKLTSKLVIKEAGKVAIKEAGKVGLSRVLDAGIEVMSENLEAKTGIDKYQYELLMKTVKNSITADIKGQVVDVTFIVGDSLEETSKYVTALPKDAPMDASLRTYYNLMTLSDSMKKDKNYLGWIETQVATAGFAEIDGLVQIFNNVGKKGGNYIADKVRQTGLFNDTAKSSQRTVGSVTKLDKDPPNLIRVSHTSDSISFTFNEPMSVGMSTTVSGYSSGGDEGSWTDSWSKNRKTFTQRYSGQFTSGSTIEWAINDTPAPSREKFNDLAGNPVPTKSGSFSVQ